MVRTLPGRRCRSRTSSTTSQQFLQLHLVARTRTPQLGGVPTILMLRATNVPTITMIVVAMFKSKSSGSSKTVPTVLTAATTANLTTRMHPTQHMSSWRRAYCRVQLRIPTLRRKTTSSTPLHQCYLSLQSLRQLLPILCSSRLTQLTYTLQVPLYRCTGKVRKSGTQATSPKQMCGEVPTA